MMIKDGKAYCEQSAVSRVILHNKYTNTQIYKNTNTWIKDGKAFSEQSAVSRVIIYDICSATVANFGPRKLKWVIGHNSSHGM